MPFKYRRQPLKAIYLLVSALFLLLRIPFWTLRNLFPSWRPRRQWSLARSLLVELINAATAIMLSTTLPSAEPLERLKGNSNFVWVEPAAHLVTGEVRRFTELNGVEAARTGVFWYSRNHPQEKVGQRAYSGEKVLYLLHGGGFVMGSAAPSFLPTATICKGLLQTVPHLSRIFALEYRLSSGPPFPSTNSFPASLIDAIAGYRYLIEDAGFPPCDIIVCGDSAGGILAYQLTRYLTTDANANTNLAGVGTLLLLSPSADSALRRNTPSMCENTRSDYVRTWFDAAYGVHALLGSLPPDELDKPWLSPGSLMFADDAIKGLFKAFPPTCILAGEAEMSRDSMRVLKRRMAADMGDDKVTYVEVANAPHDFLALEMLEPERSEGLRRVAAWISGVV
ncbi:Alpha/Beta hydrolase protein [Favolaschia claudopus]|uniref:Alpha/Beta hydrolase protein n=1 Tax=Favolaschia claudopus TaxID=2862362 RepID=A0AAW0C0Z0_9AGAR